MDKSSFLQHQNTKLSAQLEEKRREHRVLQEKLNSFEGKEQEYAQTLLCVNRLWGELSHDLQHLCASAALPSPADANGGVEDGARGQGSCSKGAPVPASITDPFLRHLLAGADARTMKEVADGCKQLEKEQTEVEQLLVARASGTKRQLTHLLKLIEQQHHHQKQSDSAHGEQEQQQQQNVRLQAQVNHLVAQHRTLTAQLQASDDRWLEGQEQIKKLQNELADAEQELSNAQRKLFTIKSSNDMAAKDAPATPAAARTGSGTPGTTAAATPAPSAPVQADMADELQELQHLLQKRTAELDKERELHMKTSRELQEALARVADEGHWVHNTRKYQAVVAEVERLQELLAARGREIEAALRERDLAEVRAADKAGCAQREVQLLARLREQEVRWHALAAAKADLERARDELELQLQQERSRLGNHQTVAELHAMISSLKTVIELKEQEARLAKVGQHWAVPRFFKLCLLVALEKGS
ncbi:hypothetical protein DUNSADRAFT_2652 [Dunaliella salina]|uniref:E3 ubiquitin protein ligase n=1 Tax=Dunaliella salina TaxID=3046 RepID=A0ABQ7H858_DUNSA|nr:hypothetical protein DUNSADRAFT_2652 [Dunaliella salina]|eukprot:KAF5843039.1 hypothetical protein DUNSADRAFT_2652 [Dunaliella salina]